MKKLLILLMIIAAPVWAAEPFTPAQEARIKEMIRETLVSNPDILAQAVDARQQQTAGQQISRAIKQNAKTLYRDPASPRLGAANAKLTLVTFTDYNCPYCKRFDPMLEKIVKQYPDVALVVKLLPFKGESSVSSARVALTTATAPGSILGLASAADGEKGFHDNASIAAAQEKTGVKAVAPSEQSMTTLRTNMELAEQLGVQGTPATLIGDRMLPGAVSYEELEAMVKQQLAKAKMAKLKRWGRELLLLALIALAVVTVMDWLNAPQAPPAFDAQTLTTLDGERVSLAQLSHERPLLVYFWASWCGVCRFTTPDVARLQAAGGNVLTVALRSGDDTRVKHWLARKRLALPVVNDPDGTLSAQWQIGVTPTFVVVSQGKVVQSTTGWTSYWG